MDCRDGRSKGVELGVCYLRPAAAEYTARRALMAEGGWSEPSSWAVGRLADYIRSHHVFLAFAVDRARSSILPTATPLHPGDATPVVGGETFVPNRVDRELSDLAKVVVVTQTPNGPARAHAIPLVFPRKDGDDGGDGAHDRRAADEPPRHLQLRLDADPRPLQLVWPVDSHPPDAAPSPPRPPPVDEEPTGKSSASEPRALRKAEISRVVRGRAGAFRDCYDALLQVRPELAGRVKVGFTIAPSGAVGEVELLYSTLLFEPFERCILDTFRSLRFPASTKGMKRVTWPLVFAPPKL
jgi:hypothetical protein